ncbi:MAG: hypothetical protein MI975_28375 [Cytophagales bacterium]|nr:hypothetical protein [Cytophagales bacterium]
MNWKWILIVLVIGNTIRSYAGNDNTEENKETKRTAFPEDGIFTGRRESNLLANPGFENRTSRWTLGKVNGGIGLFTTDSVPGNANTRKAVVITKNENKNYGDVQLFTYFNLTDQTAYSIEFMAEVEKTSLISISIGNGFTTFYEKKFLLRPEVKHYGPFHFASKINEPFCFFSFNLGKTNTTILLDDVIVRADHTEREFNKVIANSGINLHYNQSDSENSVFLSLPTELSTELPIMLYDENKNLVFAKKLRRGEKEAIINLDKELDKGIYVLKLYRFDKLESFKFTLH